MTKRVFNFNPGPAVLPLEVLETAQSELLDLLFYHREDVLHDLRRDARACDDVGVG